MIILNQVHVFGVHKLVPRPRKKTAMQSLKWHFEPKIQHRHYRFPDNRFILCAWSIGLEPVRDIFKFAIRQFLAVDNGMERWLRSL